MFGQHLHRLDLIWSRPLASPLQHFPPGAQAEAGAAFLILLRSQDVQLRELVLTDWVFSYKWGHRGKLLYTLANFLSSQRKLEILSIQNACLGLGEAMRLLAATVRSCGLALKELDLCGAFRDWQAAHTNTKYLESLGLNIAHYEDLCYFLLPSIPLSNFQLLSGSVWDQSRSRNFRSTVRLLLSYYTDTLENIHLHLKNNREMLDDLLLELLNRCCQLSHLQYDGVLRNMDTVREMCLMQVNMKTNFHTLHVKPRTLNSTNRLIVRDICSKFTNKLAEQRVHLKIEDPSSVIVFC
ncbi:hypothetical protein C0J52_21366 [Blattella germanica]|nr:hypothetical protein C0J52_21366 [Blattella germanica]